jgi:hypothetical protein
MPLSLSRVCIRRLEMHRQRQNKAQVLEALVLPAPQVLENL